jgi:hypothetical protein
MAFAGNDSKPLNLLLLLFESIWAMSAPRFATMSSFSMIGFGEYHEPIFHIEIPWFQGLWFVSIVLVFVFHKKNPDPEIRNRVFQFLCRGH